MKSFLLKHGHLLFGLACLGLFLYNVNLGLALFGIGVMVNGISGIRTRHISFAGRGGRRFTHEGDDAVMYGYISLTAGAILCAYASWALIPA